MLNPVYVCNNIKIFINVINIFRDMTNSNESNMKIFLLYLERDIQCDPV